MIRLFRWLIRLVTGAVLLSILSVAVLYWFFARSIPDYSETLSVRGLGAEVEIVRDTASVPHIFGTSDEDVYFGLGMAHAQDRLWQMLLLRRTVQGRLSELFGQRTIRTDSLMRRLGLYNAAVRSVASQDQYTQDALTAYAAGVNAWLEEVNTGARGRGAPEFWFFEPSVAPWQPADSLAVIKLMALQQTSSLEDEVLRARMSLLLPEARVADILPDTPGQGIAALPEYASLFPELPRFAADTSPERDPLSPELPRDLRYASNAWAAAPDRSAAGGTLLAGDPHLELTAPSIWYLARLELASGGVIGGTLPGVPMVFVGRSDKLAWSLTTTGADDQDVVIERINPDNPEEVRTPDGWAKLRSRPSIIRVRDAADVTLTLRWSPNGPLLTGSDYNLGTITPRGHVAALQWTALAENDTSLSAGHRLLRAGDIDEAMAATALHVAPAMNLTLIDREDIAMKSIGALPRRAARHATMGRLPSPGWEARNLWQGVLDYSSNPEFVSPDGGIVGNTNNKIINRPFPLHVSYEWGDTQRVQRWRRLMQTREVHTRESFIEAQLDTVSVTARTLLPLVAADLWFTGEAAEEGTPERQRRRALDLLAEWNGEMNEHLPEPLIYAAWMRELQIRLTRDELGPLATSFSRPQPIFIERVFRDVDGASVWCDVIQSAPEESCTDMARAALDDALLWISERYGTDLESLRWGDAHEALHRHTVLGDIAWLGWIVNIRQSISGGDNTLLRAATRGTGDDPFTAIKGSGYRGVYDFADPDSSVYIISTGQSGHPLSRHYDDLGELWRQGEYIPMSLDPQLARAGAAGVTRLLPR